MSIIKKIARCVCNNYSIKKLFKGLFKERCHRYINRELSNINKQALIDNLIKNIDNTFNEEQIEFIEEIFNMEINDIVVSFFYGSNI
jgi:uncharacterized Rmd1/YagE family protein